MFYILTMIDIDNELFIIIPGFGGNNINHKIEILQSNLNIIQSTWICDKISIIIYVYDPDIIQLIPKELFNNTNIKWIIQKGVVGNYLLQFQNEMKYSENSYLLILLDDVQLSNNVKLSKMVEYLNEFSFDIISPCLTANSKYQFNYMLHTSNNENALFVTSACELFCYFMKSKTFKLKYSKYINETNPWMWGIDMMLYNYFKLKVALINGMTMTHYYKNESYNETLPNPFEGQKILFESYNTSMDELSKQKAIRYVIYEM